MEHLELPENTAALLRDHAAAAGYGGDVAAYLTAMLQRDALPAAAGDEELSAYDVAQQLGIIGCIKDGPPDLATNPKYMEGFGRDQTDRTR